MATETNAPASFAPSVTCPKCMGSGKFIVSSPYTGRESYRGKCYECDGTGKVSAKSVETSKAARSRTGNALYTAQIVMDAADRGEDRRVEFYMRLMILDMVTIGTANARKVLDELTAGAWCNGTAECHEDIRGQLDPETASALRAQCIKLGHEFRANPWTREGANGVRVRTSK